MLASHCKRVIGVPSSLLKLPCGATVLPTDSKICCNKSLVVVLPCEPVIAITVKSGKASRTCEANLFSAANTSFTTMQRFAEGSVTSANTAPLANAASIYLWPSAFSPFRARKIEPEVALFESKTGGALTAKSSPINSPPTIFAISDACRVIIA